PEYRCEISGTGYVCLDCFSTGICVANGDGTYSVEFNYNCPDYPSATYCDDTLSNPENFGTCFRLPPAYTNCSCSSNTQCMADVNNPAVVLHCESSPPVTDPPCSNSILDLTTCGCASCSDSCPFLDDPNDDCSSYFICYGTDFIQDTCSDGFCFHQESCLCVERGWSSTLFPTSTAITVVTPLTCPADCPFVDDPYDNCSR
ncbi:Endoplasmic reticulum resident protein 29, partial [Armadillidium vulgare]